MTGLNGTRRVSPRRRGRDGEEWEQTKRAFKSTVSTALAELMEKHGYNRERATCALLRQLAASSCGPADETETYAIMRKYGLRNLQAQRVFAVAHSLQSQQAEHLCSVAKAVEMLTNSLARSKLVQHDDNPNETAARPSSPELVRLPPVHKADRTPSMSRLVSSSAKTVAFAKKSGQNGTTMKKSGKTKKEAPVSTKTLNRKRSADESSTTSDATSVERPRSNSLEVVSAKLADNNNNTKVTDPTSTTKLPSASPAIRAKRNRTDENDHATGKRPRQSSV